MIDALHDGASHGECDVDVTTEKQVVGYRQKPSSPAVVAAEAALRATATSQRIATGGASDANVSRPPASPRQRRQRHRAQPRADRARLRPRPRLDARHRVHPARRGGRRMSSRFERIGTETIFDGKFFTVRRDTLPPRGRRGGPPRARRASGSRRRRRPRRRSSSCGSCASRARRSTSRTCSRSSPAGWTYRARTVDDRQARAGRGDRQAGEAWESLGSFYTSPGFTDEEIHLFLATGISDVAERPEVEENERIDIEVRPLAELDQIIAANQDSKTLIALYRLRDRLGRRLSARSVAPKRGLHADNEGCSRWPSSTLALPRPRHLSRSSTSCSTSSRIWSSSAALSQHARGLPLGPAAVRRVPERARRARGHAFRPRRLRLLAGRRRR